MIDYHTHTYLCRHAQGTLEEYVEIAREKGLQEIGFADHFPLDLMGHKPKDQVTMNGDELELYLEMVEKASRAADEIQVKTGIEIDYIPGKIEKVTSILDEYPFDYIIGSIHFMGDWDFTHPYYADEFNRCSLDEVYEKYFSLVGEACKSGLIDIIGHVDVVKKFDYRLGESALMPFYDELAKVLRDTGVCLEVNTGGLDAPVKEIYPSKELLQQCVRMEVDVVLGSDAHAPKQVGRYFPEAIEFMREAGVKKITRFSKRKRSSLPLESG